MIKSKLLEAKLDELLNQFFDRRIETLQKLDLIKTLKRKNPYLYRAVGVGSASEIVREILLAFISSSDETNFGTIFFEPLAKWAAEQTACKDMEAKVNVGNAAGVDITIEDAVCFMAIAVKSGTHVFNKQSRETQVKEFEALRSRLFKLKKRFDPVVGYCYGKKSQHKQRNLKFQEFAGQKFWHLITHEEDFYLRIIELMEKTPKLHAPKFKDEFTKAENRFVKEFLYHFSKKDGSIDWRKLAKMNSGQDKFALIPYASTKV
jgi:hypothetical protein